MLTKGLSNSSCFIALRNRLSPNRHLSTSKRYFFASTIAQKTNAEYLPNEEGIVRSEFPSVPVQSVPFTDTLQKAIWEHSVDSPGRAAFIDAQNPSDTLTFSGFLLQAQTIAQFLHSIGFARGDIAGVVTPNCWHFLAVSIGAAMQRGCIAGVNSQFTKTEIASLFIEANCKVVFFIDTMLDKMLAVQRACPQIKHLILIPSDFPAQPLPNLPPSVIHWADIVAQRPQFSHSPPSIIDVAKELMYLPFSSGTTGPPKGVMLSHRNIGTMVAIAKSHLDELILTRMDPNWNWRREHFLMVLPLYHIYGFVSSLIWLLAGGTMISFRKFDLDLFCRTVQNYKVKFTTLVPPILVAMVKSPEVLARYDLSSLRYIITGAAPAGRDLLDEVRRQIPSLDQISQGYGMTEQSMSSHMPVYGMHNTNAVGRLNANYEMKVVDVDTGKPLGVGQQGEIWTRSPTTMLGYLNRPDSTAETVNSEGWLRTGDIGYFDENGWTYVVDRLKELIKVKGLQVAPAELEDLLLTHPDVKDSAVIGVPDERAGELPKAFVVRANETLSEREVMDFVKAKVAPFKQLKCVEFVREIPKSPSGKILRRILREKAKNN